MCTKANSAAFVSFASSVSTSTVSFSSALAADSRAAARLAVRLCLEGLFLPPFLEARGVIGGTSTSTVRLTEAFPDSARRVKFACFPSGRGAQRKITKQEDDLKERQTHRKTTS